MRIHRLLPLPVSLPNYPLALLTSLAAIPALSAQDLRQVLPEPVPKLVEAPAGDAPAPEVDFSELKAQLGGAAPDEVVLLDLLKGVILLKDESRVGKVTLAPGQHFNPEEFPELDTQALQGVIDLFVGESVSQESILRLRMSIGMVLAEQGRPFSVVYVPPQDITDGILQIVIVVSALGELRVEGATHFSEDQYTSRVGQTLGQPIDAGALTIGLDRINQNSFRQASVRAERGEEPGTTDLIIQTRELFPLRFFGGYSNTGTRATTEDRIFTGVNWGNAFGLGHVATLQWTSDLDARYSRSISANYSADLPRNHSFTLFTAYSYISSVPNDGLFADGVSWQIGANYDIPLTSTSKKYTHSLQVGIDYKSSDNNIEFALPPFVIPISDTLTHIAQLRAQYRGTLSDRHGSTTAGLQLTVSPGGLNSKNDDAAFEASRYRASSSYAYVNLNLNRQTMLDAIIPGAIWAVRGELQLSTTNLLGSEQFSGGGIQTVRGYEQGEFIGDNALFFSQELILPSFSVMPRVITDGPGDELIPYVFHDYARLWNVDRLPGEKAFHMHSVGLGLRYQISRHGNVEAAYGWQLRDSDTAKSDKSSRFHVSATLSF